jgi:hypothetical protein
MSDSENRTEVQTPEASISEVPETPSATKTPRLKAAERNRIIEDFKSGTIHPDFEIFSTKVDGKYIVKPRKQKLTDEQVKKVSPSKVVESKPKVNEAPATILPSVSAKKN